MPTQTFFNLPPEKQQRIMDAAITEFSMHSFKNASVASIVEAAGIPRGSFYQYFSDLFDVYKYVLTTCGQMKLTYLKDLTEKLDQMETFSLIKELYVAGLRFAHEHPTLAAIGNLFVKEDQHIRQQIMGGNEEMATHFYTVLLERGQQRGEIRENVNLQVASFMFYTINTAFIDLFLKPSKEGEIISDVDAFLSFLDDMLLVFKTGLSKTTERE